MDANEVVTALDWLAKVLVSAGIVFGLIWRILNGMISKKVDGQIAKLAEKVTKTSSEGMEKLRQEMANNHQAQLDRTDERFDRLTDRIDDLIDRKR